MNIVDILTPLVEIGVIAVILNYLLSFFWNTRSMDLLIGVLAFFIIFAVSSLLGLPVLYTIMTNLANIAAVGLVVIFQPELRVALSKLSLKGKRYREITAFDKFLDQLTNSIYKLSEKKLGALIALEYTDRLDDFAQKAVILNANFSSELLETIFSPSTPLHDGAVIIREMTIVAAAVILPLANEMIEVSSSMGTRHRAALGISQTTNALVIAISEESGKVSLARDGVISRGVKINQFKGILHSIYSSSALKPKRKRFRLKEWMGF
ncbi:MAG: diadenylate cyclase CdaA [Candidatus Rhabdochlamydia sp.]